MAQQHQVQKQLDSAPNYLAKHPRGANILLFSTTYCFLFTCLDCGSENQRGIHLKFDSDIVSEQEGERGVCAHICVCVCICVCVSQLQLPLPWKLLQGKMLTIYNQRNLVIFPCVGRQPADPNLIQTEHWSNLCAGWHQVHLETEIKWERELQRDKVKGGDRERVPRPLQETKVHPRGLKKNPLSQEIHVQYSAGSSAQLRKRKKEGSCSLAVKPWCLNHVIKTSLYCNLSFKRVVPTLLNSTCLYL